MDSDLVDRKIKEFDAWMASRATEPPRSVVEEDQDEVSSADVEYDTDDADVPEIPRERWDDLS